MFVPTGNVKLGDYFSADIGGGYFQQGRFDLPDVLGQNVYTFGVSSRVSAFSKGNGNSQALVSISAVILPIAGPVT